ncbi:LrgB family protein [Planococcus shenhongbingii]|uniref:LrgB family protein n=1 Tax=Planococcus shenhongbingii TaxID=3058398 RepID=A0ABT8NGS9_9BACL|nr:MULTISPECIES: LrgB family protein [unclassified Planococcus (in: firmicutes)]MDN7246862.1 LrgB family protein [Planococcus sp. N017]WKA58783.1 LrgB family protein [Planococcus sp. N016]
MVIFLLSLLFAGLTIVAYLFLNSQYNKYRWTLLNPVLTTTVVLVIILLVFDVSYDNYMLGGKWIGELLGPAVVALAVPLYKQRDLLRQNLLPITIGVSAGAIVGLTSGALLTKLFQFSNEMVLTMLPKSITTPVAMQMAEALGGIPSLAAVYVMTAGFTGIIAGPWLLKILRVDSSIGVGIGLGSSAHGLGTAKAFEYGPEEASMSSVAMTLSAVVGSFLGPVIVWLFF